MAKKKSASLLGSVDLFGLNAFGQSPMSPVYGALIGGGAATVGAFAASKTAAADKKEWIGLGAGLAAAGALYANKKTRPAALGAAVGSFLAVGMPMLFKAVSGQALGVAQVEYLNGLGVPQINYLNGAGLGLPGISMVPDAQGTIPGVHGTSFAGPQIGSPGASAPVDLLGAATAQSNQVSLLGGPTISNLSQAYGATLLGGGR